MKSIVLLFLINLILVNSSYVNTGEKILKIFRRLEADETDDISDSPTEPSDLTDSNSIDEETTPNDSNSTYPYIELPDSFILGFDNYNYENNLLTFFAYVFHDKLGKNFNINLIIDRNLRLLDETEENVECTLNETLDEISVYKCSKSLTYSINNIKCDLKDDSLNYTKLAKNMCENLQNQKGNKISKKGLIILRDCEIIDQDKKITISGTTGEDITNETNSNLSVLSEDGNILIIPTQFIKQNSGNYNMELNYKRSLKANLSESLGIIEGGKNYYLIFNKDKSSQLNFEQKAFKNTFTKKKSSGLSAGAIVAIVVPLILVLFVVAGGVAYIKKNPTIPHVPMENNNAGNNTIGISSSSTNVVNK